MNFKLIKSARVSIGGMALAAMLILAFGAPSWDFPWWLWLLAIVDSISRYEE